MMDNKEIESLMKIMAFDASKSYVTWKEVKLRMLVCETHRKPYIWGFAQKQGRERRCKGEAQGVLPSYFMQRKWINQNPCVVSFFKYGTSELQASLKKIENRGLG